MMTGDAAPRAGAREELFHFDSVEAEMYELQIHVLLKDLSGSMDTLSNYTCHSQPHIIEVMEQADMLLAALREWLLSAAGFEREEMPDVRRRLLLAAKFHDIGMAGTLTLRRLLHLTDQMHAQCRGASPSHAVFSGQVIQEFGALAQRADAECSRWNGYIPLRGRLFNRIAYGSDPSDICLSLEAYHELLKNTIRKYHAENSARWIMQNRDRLAQRYGRDINWTVVGLIAALHTGTLFAHTDENGLAAGWRAYCERLCALFGTDGAFLRDPVMERRLLALTSILRVADQRRTGARLLTLDRRKISVATAADGRLVIEYAVDGLARRSRMARSNATILAEKLNEFGSVEVRPEGERWIMTHSLRFSHTENGSGRHALIHKRIPSYIQEIQNSAFRTGSGIKHILSIDIVDGRGKPPSADALSFSAADLLSLEDGKPDDPADVCARAIDEQLRKYSSMAIRMVERP